MKLTNNYQFNVSTNTWQVSIICNGECLIDFGRSRRQASVGLYACSFLLWLQLFQQCFSSRRKLRLFPFNSKKATAAIPNAVEQCTSLYIAQRQVFLTKNLLLPNTTDILVRSELTSLAPIAHEFTDCKLIAAWIYCLPWQFWKCTSVCITQRQVFAQYCHGGWVYSASELLIMHIIQCYNRPVQKRKFPNRFIMPRWRMFMRTTLDLSASLIEEAMELTNIRTKTEVITRALENLIQKEKVQQHTINNDL